MKNRKIFNKNPNYYHNLIKAADISNNLYYFDNKFYNKPALEFKRESNWYIQKFKGNDVYFIDMSRICKKIDTMFAKWWEISSNDHDDEILTLLKAIQ